MNKTNTTKYIYYQPSWSKYCLLINAILIVLVNLYVLLLIARKRSHLPSICNIFLFGLLMSHLGAGTVSSLMFNVDSAINNSTHEHNGMYERLTLCIYHFCGVSTFCMIILVTIDRLLAIKWPFIYNQLTWKFCAFSISTIMVFPIIFIIFELRIEIHSYNIILFCKAMTSIVLAFSHHLIYREVKAQFQKISKTIVCDDLTLQGEKREKLNQRMVKSTRMCYFIVLSNIIFWIPCSITSVFILNQGNKYWNEITIQVQCAVYVFLNVNSIKDPLMYVVLNKSLKDQFLLDFRMKWRKSLFHKGRNVTDGRNV